jgi:putative uncharacterized protein FNV1057
MKKIGILVLLILNLFLLTNCNKDGKKEENKNEGQTEVQVKKEETTVKENEGLTEKEKKIIKLFNKDSLEEFLGNTKKIEEKLKGSTEEEANKLFQEYSNLYGESDSNEMIPSLILKLNSEHNNILNEVNYYSDDNDVPEGKINAADIMEIPNKFLANYGLRINYVGEGYYEMDVIASFYYDLFKNYVTDDYREYLRIRAKESGELYALDGCMVISAEELGERIAAWESFLEEYPDSEFSPVVDENCCSYREDYILGMLNTPTIEEDDNGKPKSIYEECLKEYYRFMKKYPNSPTVKLIEYFLENYKNKNISDVIQNMIQKTRKYKNN